MPALIKRFLTHAGQYRFDDRTRSNIPAGGVFAPSSKDENKF